MSPTNKFLFSETNFDRSSKIRGDASKLRHLINDPDTKHILLWRGKVLFNFSYEIPQLAQVDCYNKIWNNINQLNIERGNFIGFPNWRFINFLFKKKS